MNHHNFLCAPYFFVSIYFIKWEKYPRSTKLMQKNNILTDNEVAEGLILTCQAHPETDTLTVDYDDV